MLSTRNRFVSVGFALLAILAIASTGCPPSGGVGDDDATADGTDYTDGTTRDTYDNGGSDTYDNGGGDTDDNGGDTDDNGGGDADGSADTADCKVWDDNDITTDTTFAADCYRLPSGLHVREDALLTIKPGVTLIFEEGTRATVRGAKLKAVGTESEKITFTGAEEIPGFWKGLGINRSNSTDNALEHVVIEYGGGKPYEVGINEIPKANLGLNNHGDVQIRFSIKNVTLRHSGGWGLSTGNGEPVVTAFENNTLTKNNLGPAIVTAESGHWLDPSSTFSGNDEDYVRISGEVNGTERKEVTWPTLDVPYYAKSNIKVSDDGHLTLSPGTKIIFHSSTWLRVRNGKLTADGEQGNRIVLTGEEHTKGYWNGVGINRSNSTDNVLDYVTIEDGGGQKFEVGINDAPKANLALNGHGDQQVRIAITNSTFRNSEGFGLSTHKAGNVNITECANNTFEDNASGPSSENATCP